MSLDDFVVREVLREKQREFIRGQTFNQKFK